MDNVPVSPLVAEWTRAVVNVDLDRVRALYETNPELLWTPLDANSTRLETDYGHLIAQLERYQLLGSTLGNLAAIPYTLLDHLETEDEETLPLTVAQQKRSKLLSYLIKQSRPEDLNTYAWGSCHNKTLHLAYFLGHTQASQQLIQQGALDTVANDLGFQPKDVISQQTKKDNSKKPSGKQQRPKYSSPDRFQQLRALAESPAKQQQEDANNNNNSKNAPDDVRPQGQRHHQDFALLAKRSPVKNNPLLKKFEQQQQSSSSANRLAVPSGKAASLLSPDSAGGDPEIRRNSKVINSLKNKSYVSTSVFRQAEPAVSTSRAPSPSRGASPTPSRSTSPLPSRSASPLPPVTVTPAQDTSSKIPENDMTKQPIQTADSEKGGSENLSAQKKEQPVIVCQEEQTPEEKDKKRSVDKDDDKGQDVDKEDQTSKGRDQDKEEQGLKREQGPDMDKEPVADDKDDVDKEQDDDKDDDEEDEEDVTKARDIEKEKQRLSRRFVSADAEEARRWSGSQRSHWSVGVNSWGNVLNRGSVASKKENRKSLHSDSDGEQWFDSYEDWTEGADGRLSLKAKPRNSRDGIPPVPNLPTTTTTSTTARQSMLSRQVLPDAPSPVVQLSQVDSHEKETEENNTCGEEEGPEEMIHYKPDTRFSARFDDDEDSVIDSLIHDNSLRQSRSVDAKQAEGNKSGDETSVESRAPSASFSPPQRGSAGAESMDTWPSPEVKKQTLSEQHDEKDAVPAEPSQILMKPDEKFGSVSVTTSQYISHRLRPESNNLQEQALATFDNEAYRDFLEYRPSSVKLQLPIADVSPSRPLSSATAMMSNPAHGKLYVRVNSAEDLLLPLPKITTYVRCVVSDGQYEYMSKYEVLSQRVSFAYECIIDTHPDMIVTVALHVRPDVHVRPKTGISRWFTSIRKQRETLPGYVHPEDGAIGQSRFALQHMMEACYQKTYKANFDCFNSWYARSARERQRQQQFGGDDDVLKVVGNLNVEMLYLPVSDPSLSIPRSLRECDLALRIRQWHETCWHSGYLAMRQKGSKLWERQYCRLIGSQLIGYESKETTSWKPLSQYDIADAIRLTAASDQVVITLEDLPDSRYFQEDTIVEETGRGFFRITFPEFHLDCVSDHAHESEEWVKMLRSMIGRVPLKLPFSV